MLVETGFKGLYVIPSIIYPDIRGTTVETLDYYALAEELNWPFLAFKSDLVAYSRAGVFRGLHYQYPVSQSKLIRCAAGRILDFAVDMRTWEPTFGKIWKRELTAESYEQVWIPRGFAHGYLALEDSTVEYKLTVQTDVSQQHVLSWYYVGEEVKFALGDWGKPIMSDRDRKGLPFVECKYFEVEK
jgi:dTDP-4-dehydrorhamnose 3,5-epimerase